MKVADRCCVQCRRTIRINTKLPADKLYNTLKKGKWGEVWLCGRQSCYDLFNEGRPEPTHVITKVDHETKTITYERISERLTARRLIAYPRRRCNLSELLS